MKRNESILVYAVTGLLLVILLIAVVFGESKPAVANSDGDKPPKVAILPGVAPVNPQPKVDAEKTGKEDTERDGDPTGPGEGGTDSTNTENPRTEDSRTDGPETEVEVDGESGTGGEDPVTAGKGPVDLNATVVTAEMKLERVLGTSNRNREFRVVTSRRGDTLAAVVKRWCGDAEFLPDAEAVNENLIDGALTPGQKVVVPWVDAEILLAAEKVRVAAVAEVEYAKGKIYSLKKGDSLWKLAKIQVGEDKLIPAWLERFKQLNPEITDPSVLVVGQKVRLPR